MKLFHLQKYETTASWHHQIVKPWMHGTMKTCVHEIMDQMMQNSFLESEDCVFLLRFIFCDWIYKGRQIHGVRAKTTIRISGVQTCNGFITIKPQNQKNHETVNLCKNPTWYFLSEILNHQQRQVSSQLNMYTAPSLIKCSP